VSSKLRFTECYRRNNSSFSYTYVDTAGVSIHYFEFTDSISGAYRYSDYSTGSIPAGFIMQNNHFNFNFIDYSNRGDSLFFTVPSLTNANTSASRFKITRNGVSIPTTNAMVITSIISNSGNKYNGSFKVTANVASGKTFVINGSFDKFPLY